MTDTVIHDRNPRWMREVDNRKPRAMSMGGHKKHPDKGHRKQRNQLLDTYVPGSTIKDTHPTGPAEVVGDIYELTNMKFHVVEARVQEVVDVVHDANTATNKRLTELDNLTENLGNHVALLGTQVALLLEQNTTRLSEEQEKQTKSKAKNGRSMWRKLYNGRHGSSSGLAHKYIVD